MLCPQFIECNREGENERSRGVEKGEKDSQSRRERERRIEQERKKLDFSREKKKMRQVVFFHLKSHMVPKYGQLMQPVK